MLLPILCNTDSLIAAFDSFLGSPDSAIDFTSDVSGIAVFGPIALEVRYTLASRGVNEDGSITPDPGVEVETAVCVGDHGIR